MHDARVNVRLCGTSAKSRAGILTHQNVPAYAESVTLPDHGGPAPSEHVQVVLVEILNGAVVIEVCLPKS